MRSSILYFYDTKPKPRDFLTIVIIIIIVIILLGPEAFITNKYIRINQYVEPRKDIQIVR